jgi:muramidase (phage lysozyme)
MAHTKKAVKKHSIHLTEKSDIAPSKITLDAQKIRLEENKEYLKNMNVRAFLDTIAWAEGGDYHARFGYGWAKGDWSFKDESTHPGPGSDGKTTAAGRYQITKKNWQENGLKKMGLSDFSPKTQDLIAIEGFRQAHSIDAIVNGDMVTAIKKSASIWNALPLGKGLKNRVEGQHYQRYENVISA